MLTLICFFAGLSLVATTIALTMYWAHREPHLEARRAAVFEVTYRPARIEAARAELARTRGEINSARRMLEKIQQRLADWLPLEDTPANAWKYFMLAAILALLEAVLFFLYGLGSHFANAPAWMLALVAAPAAAIVIALLHILLATAFGKRHRPARTLHRARIGLVVTVVLVLLAIWAVLGGRNLTDPGAIEALTIAGLLALASTTSLAGGFAALVGTTLLEESEMERNAARLQALLQALEDHETAIAAELGRLEDSTTKSTAGFAVPTGIVPVLVFALLMTPFITSKLSAASPAIPVTTFDRDGACESLIDVTNSVNPLARQQAVVRIRELLPAMVDNLGCRVVRVVPFGADPAINMTEIPIPNIPDLASACRDASTTSTTGAAHTAALFYPVLNQYKMQQARVACEAKLANQKQQQMAARRQVLAEVGAALERAARVTPRGNCTAIMLAVRRALQRAQHIVTVTDGEDNCPIQGGATPLDKTSSLLFVVVSSNYDSADSPEATFSRLGALQAAFPGSRALLLGELTLSSWRAASH